MGRRPIRIETTTTLVRCPTILYSFPNWKMEKKVGFFGKDGLDFHFFIEAHKDVRWGRHSDSEDSFLSCSK